MCYPVLIPIAIAVASAAAGYASEDQQAHSQAHYQASVARQASASAKSAYDISVQQATLQQHQAGQALSQKVSENQKQIAQAKASTKVSSAESGVSGLSIDALYQGYDQAQSLFASSATQNYNNERQQAGVNLLGIQAGQQNNLNAMTRFAPITGPSALQYGLQAAGGSADAYAQYNPPKQNS